MNTNIAIKISKIQKEINNISAEYLLSSSNITLIAVSKNQSVEKIEEAIQAGQIDFGENYVQEAESKWLSLKKRYPQVRLHLIGNLQSNKAKKALEIFDVIHTLDSISLAKKLSKLIEENQLKNKKFLIQILLDTNRETKHGLPAEELSCFLNETEDLNLDIIGLMGVAPTENPAPYFAFLMQQSKEYKLKNLSMGMSGDYKEAIRFGSTMLRLGTAIFGSR